MNVRSFAALAAAPLLVGACGGSGGSSGGDTAASVGSKICAAAPDSALASGFGSSVPDGSPVEPQTGVHGCVWQSSDLVVGVAAFENKADLPSGDSAATDFASLLGVDNSGFSNSSISTSTSSASSATASLVLSNSQGALSDSDVAALQQAAQSAMPTASG